MIRRFAVLALLLVALAGSGSSTVTTAYTPLVYAGNGVATSFTVSWPFVSGATDLVVSRVSATGTVTSLAYGTHYTVTGGGGLTGAVSYPVSGSPLASGESLRISRATAATQPTALPSNGPFRPQSVEQALDRAVLQNQEQAELLGRVPRLAPYSPSAAPVLPEPSDGSWLRWSGGNLENFTPALGLTASDAAIQSYFEGTGAGTAGQLKGVYYVSTSASITDHGDAAVTGSLAWCLAQGGTDPGAVVLPPKGDNYVSLVAIQVPADTVVNLGGNTLEFRGAASAGLHVVGSNVWVENGHVIHNGTGASSDLVPQIPIVVGSFTDPDIVAENVSVRGVTIENNHASGLNGINVVGNARNVVLENLRFPSSTILGLGVLVHWGYRYGAATETHHPTNIQVRNIQIGTLTNATYAGFGAMGILVSGAVNVTIDGVVAESLAGQIALLYAGDYGYSLAADAAIASGRATYVARNLQLKSGALRGITVDGLAGTSLTYERMAVLIENATLQGTSSASVQDGIYIKDVSHVEVRNGVAKGWRNGLSMVAGVGATMEAIRIIGGAYTGNRLNGINATDGGGAVESPLILGAEANSNGASGTLSNRSGIRLNGTLTNPIVDNCVLGSASETVQFYGVYISSAVAGTIIRNNHIHGVATGGAGINPQVDYISSIYEMRNNTAAAGVAIVHTSTYVPIGLLPTNAGDTRLFLGPVRPASGTWKRGDIVLNSLPSNGTAAGWVCVAAGTPGTWRFLSVMTMIGTTAGRPTFGANDYGATYMDTTLHSAGLPIWWNGTKWIRADGTDG